MKNLDNLKLKINKKEIFEYYFMMHIYYTKNWLFDDLALIEKKAGGFRKIYNEKIYDLWTKEFSSSKHYKFLNELRILLIIKILGWTTSRQNFTLKMK